MVTRIVPWPLPTIPGQATNAGSGGGGGADVQYIDFDNAVVQCGITARDGGYNNWSVYDGYGGVQDTFDWRISNVSIMDITGLSVIMEISVAGCKFKDEITVSDATYAYSVGTNINRTISKRLLHLKNNPAHVNDNDHNGMTGEYTVIIKAVDLSGKVKQIKEYRGTPVFIARPDQ